MTTPNSDFVGKTRIRAKVAIRPTAGFLRPSIMATAGGSTTEPEAFKHSFSYLVNSIDAAALLPAALSINLITDRQKSECACEADPYKKAETFLGHLLRAINSHYENFHTFVQILEETDQAQIASRLRG